MENHAGRTFQIWFIINIDEMAIDTSSGNRGSIQLYTMLIFIGFFGPCGAVIDFFVI